MKILCKRALMLLLVVTIAATINFFIPRLGGGRDPVRQKLAELAASGSLAQADIEAMVAAYQKKFGLDQPLWVQYGNYLGDIARCDFGYSLSQYPMRVSDLIADSMPWTLGLLTVAILIGFVLGNLLGAVAGWSNTPTWLRRLAVAPIALSTVPFYVVGLVLIWVFCLNMRWFPFSGGYGTAALPAPTLSFAADVVRHAVLPALSIVLVSMGQWAMGMRGMIVGVAGEDYVTLAEANGLKERTILFRYGVRNALLPQYTALGLAMGQMLSGQVVVEVVFQYPGIGTLLYNAIKSSDYTLINGIVFLTILGLGIVTMLMDLTYPWIDPRIRREGGTT